MFSTRARIPARIVAESSTIRIFIFSRQRFFPAQGYYGWIASADTARAKRAPDLRFRAAPPLHLIRAAISSKGSGLPKALHRVAAEALRRTHAPHPVVAVHHLHSDRFAGPCFFPLSRVPDHAVASGSFGFIQRLVGATQQRPGFLRVIGESGDPEGNGDGPESLIVVLELELGDFLPQSLGLAQRGVERALGQEH